MIPFSMTAPITPRVALKVDCDTFEGTKKGIPNLLNLFEKLNVKASFYFTLGPDCSGRAIRRVFTQKGFLKKMFRSKAVSLYGPKTMLYGTLLPPPMIWKNLASEIRSVEKAGHEVGVHGWDHVRWHDKLDKMNVKQVEDDYGQAFDVFASIFGRPAQASAAPGWHATATSLAVQEKRNLLYASNTRNGDPFFPEDGGRVFSTLEIPTTLPTWDESLSDSALQTEADLLRLYRLRIRGTEVHSIHTEVEGTAHRDLFQKQIEGWKTDGVTFVTLEQIAREVLLDRNIVPVRSMSRIRIPNRGGFVSSGYNETGRLN